MCMPLRAFWGTMCQCVEKAVEGYSFLVCTGSVSTANQSLLPKALEPICLGLVNSARVAFVITTMAHQADMYCEEVVSKDLPSWCPIFGYAEATLHRRFRYQRSTVTHPNQKSPFDYHGSSHGTDTLAKHCDHFKVSSTCVDQRCTSTNTRRKPR